MDLLHVLQTIFSYIQDPDEIMIALWIPAVVGTFILFIYVLIKISSYLEFQKNNFLPTAIVLILGYIALLQAILSSPTQVIQTLLDDIRPQNVQTIQVGQNDVIIQWETKKADAQYIKFRDQSSVEQIVFVFNGGAIKKHTVLLNNLQPNQKYTFSIVYHNKILTSQNGKLFEFTLQ